MIRKVKNRSLDQYTFPVDDYFAPPETIIDFMYSADCRGLTGWKIYGSLTIKTDIKKTTLRQLIGKQWSYDGLTYTLKYGGDGYDKCYTGSCVRIDQTNTAGRLCIPWDEKWAITDTDDYYDRPLSEWTYSPAPGRRVIYVTHTAAQSSRNSYFNAQLILNGGTVLDTIKIAESGAYPADRPDMLSLVANGRWYMGGSGYDVSKWGDPFGDYKFFYDTDNYLKCYNINNPTKLYKVGKTSDISSAKTIANSYPTSSLQGNWILYNQFTKSSSVYKIYLFDEDACPLNTAESRTSATTLNYNTHRQTYLQSVLPTSTGIPQLYVSEL